MSSEGTFSRFDNNGVIDEVDPVDCSEVRSISDGSGVCGRLFGAAERGRGGRARYSAGNTAFSLTVWMPTTTESFTYRKATAHTLWSSWCTVGDGSKITILSYFEPLSQSLADEGVAAWNIEYRRVGGT